MKSGWESGDRINIWFDGYWCLPAQIVLHFNGSNWETEVIDQLLSTKLDPVVGEVTAIIEKVDQATFETLSGKYLSDENDIILYCDLVNEVGHIATTADRIEMPEDISYMFSELFITSITGTEILDVSKTKNMDYLFWDCEDLTSVDLGSWDTPVLESMKGAFKDCKSLETVKLTNWTTTKDTDFEELFHITGTGTNGYSSLNDLYVSDKFYVDGINGKVDYMFTYNNANKVIYVHGYTDDNLKDLLKRLNYFIEFVD